jgi:hypothetical protein
MMQRSQAGECAYCGINIQHTTTHFVDCTNMTPGQRRAGLNRSAKQQAPSHNYSAGYGGGRGRGHPGQGPSRGRGRHRGQSY